jgi:hypothetical protein
MTRDGMEAREERCLVVMDEDGGAEIGDWRSEMRDLVIPA